MKFIHCSFLIEAKASVCGHDHAYLKLAKNELKSLWDCEGDLVVDYSAIENQRLSNAATSRNLK